MREGLPERPSCCWASSPSPTPRARRRASTPPGRYTHGPHTVDWVAESDRHVERMEAQVERFAPGFRERILARHVLAPADLQARNANLVGGDVGGGSYALAQVLFRPVRRSPPIARPCAVSTSAAPPRSRAGAVHGVPGHAAARLALTERVSPV